MHTPGPWMIEADPCHYDTLSTVVGGESQQRKSRIWRQVHVEVGGFAEVAEQEANARLIAAAPDLYEALADASFYLKSLGARLAALDLDNTETYGCLQTATMFARYLDAALSKVSQQQGSDATGSPQAPVAPDSGATS